MTKAMLQTRVAILLLVALSSLAANAFANDGIKVLYAVNANYAGVPVGNLVRDASGNLYGMTEFTGPLSCDFGPTCGVAYELSPLNGVWRPSLLQNFADDGGALPTAGLIMDGAGNLYGTATSGGSTNCGPDEFGCGVVFELSPTVRGPWIETVLYTFLGGADGAHPYAPLVMDSAGNLYGTAKGDPDSGVVFELSPSGNNGLWQETVIHTFEGIDGSEPVAGLTFDSVGNLYGTTLMGGVPDNDGVVFELKKTPKGIWQETVLHSFNGTDGASPVAGVVFDPQGNLYGTTKNGGNSQNCIGGCGVVFELSPQNDGSWSETVLQNFDEMNGSLPQANVTLDTLGNVYGTTYAGGGGSCEGGCGVIFRLSSSSQGWTESWISFQGSNGAGPLGGVIFDAEGNLYGAASSNSLNIGGVFYEVPAASFAKLNSH